MPESQSEIYNFLTNRNPNNFNVFSDYLGVLGWGGGSHIIGLLLTMPEVGWKEPPPPRKLSVTSVHSAVSAVVAVHEKVDAVSVVRR